MPTPPGEVAVSWAITDRKFTLDVNVPSGSDAEVELPISRFDKPVVVLDGKTVEPKAHVSSGAHHFELTGNLK